METIPVPLAVKLLIASHNERMEHSLKNITDSNLELMHMLRLDLDNLRYVRIQTTKPDELTSDE